MKLSPINKLISFAMFLFLISNSISLYSQRFDGGLKAGMVASEVSGDQLAGPNKLGWFAGVFTNRSVSYYSRLQLELMYITKGSRGVPRENQPRDYRFNLDYVETALFLTHSLEKYSSRSYVQKMNAEIGLSFGVLVNAYEEEYDLELDFSSERPYNQMEGSIWAGIYFPVNDNISLNFRFSNSFTPVRKHASGHVVWYNWGQYHTLWTIGLQYSF